MFQCLHIWSSWTSCVARSGNLICVQKGQSAYSLFKTLYADWPFWTQMRFPDDVQLLHWCIAVFICLVKSRPNNTIVYRNFYLVDYAILNISYKEDIRFWQEKKINLYWKLLKWLTNSTVQDDKKSWMISWWGNINLNKTK